MARDEWQDGFDLVAALAAAPADRIAAIDDRGVPIRYDALRGSANRLAGELAAEAGLVLLEGDNSADWLIAYLACLIARRPMLIAPGGNGSALTALETAFAPATRMTLASGYRPEATGRDAGVAAHPDLALMLSTSGSMGSAKCVRLSAANLAANAASIAEYL